jgi:hypothetical protein
MERIVGTAFVQHGQGVTLCDDLTTNDDLLSRNTAHLMISFFGL